MTLPDLRSINITGRRVLIRIDGDIPVMDGKIADPFRLNASLETIHYCLEQRASVVLMAHRGRPKGKHDPELSTRILVDYYSQQLGQTVQFIDEFISPKIDHPVAILENLRYHRGEEQNERGFAKLISKFGEVYVNDAFSVSHRMHASVNAITEFLPSVAGFQLLREVTALEPIREHAEAPYCAVLGGAKAMDKSPILADLVERADCLLVGGLVAMPYLLAMGQPVGAHQVDKSEVDQARTIIRNVQESGAKIYVPVDFTSQGGEVKRIRDIASNELMLDTGPETAQLYAQVLARANTIFWNGAMGKFEEPQFAKGTVAIARAIAASGAETRIASGGDTVSAIHMHDLGSGFSFISTGGGATLEFIAGRELPGITILQNKNKK